VKQWIVVPNVHGRDRFGCAIVVALISLLANVAVAACPGDCNGDGKVSVDELEIGARIALKQLPLSACPSYDAESDGAITVDDLVICSNAAATRCPVPLIITVVGSGLAGYDGDGRKPLESALYLPQDVTIGPDGILYVDDWNNHRIRRVMGDVLEAVAGNGELGSPVTGDPALESPFNHPTSIAFDHQGLMVVASWHNSMVTRVDLTTGKMAVVAGTGSRSYGGDGGPAIEARVDLPSSVTVDSQNNIIFSDQANFRIRKIDTDGMIQTIVGTGLPGYSGDDGPAIEARLNAERGQSAAPAGRIILDEQDRIYIADTSNHRVRMVDTDGTIRTVAGTGQAGYSGDGGLATEAQLDHPRDVAITSNGTLYIADTSNSVIRVVRPNGIIETYAGTAERGFSGDGGPAVEARLDRPYGVSVAPNGDVYIADSHNHRIRKVSSLNSGPPPTPRPVPTPQIIPCTDVVGSICTYAGDGGLGFNGDGLHRVRTTLYNPIDIEFTPSGRILVPDWNNFKVREILPDDTFTTIIGTDFDGDGPPDLSDRFAPGADPLLTNLNHPTAIREFANGDLLLMAWHNHKMSVLIKETNKMRVLVGRGFGFSGDGLPITENTLLNQPPHSVFDRQGNLFFVDQRNQRIRVLYNVERDRFDAVIDTVVGNPDPAPPETFLKGGYNGDGVALQTKLNFPTGGVPEPGGGITIDPHSTPESTVLYFADTLNHVIRRVQFTSPDFKTGQVTTIAGQPGAAGFSGDGGPAGSAKLNRPADIDFGPDGNLYFADTDNQRVRMIDFTDGTIRTIAGNGNRAYGGDGGPATEAALNRPFGVAFDLEGDLYISDTYNSRIRKVKLR